MSSALEAALAFYDDRATTAQARAPFRFLDAYEREDREYFFGRDLEIEDLRARFYRGQVFVVYGESGAGKTSLLQCGLANAIPSEEAEFHLIRSNVDPIEATRARLGAAGSTARLAELIEARAKETSRTVALIFDQFEEVFLFQDTTIRDELLAQLAEAVERRLDVRVVFCMREEFLSRMTEVETRMPDVFANRFWLRRMRASDARKVIEAPCRRAGIDLDPTVTDRLLERLRDGRGEIDLPYLQIVLDRLYRRASERGAPLRFGGEDLDAIGSMENVLSSFLDERVRALPDPSLGRELLKVFVTAAKTRKAVALASLERFAHRVTPSWPPRAQDITANVVHQTLEALIQARVLRQEEPNAPFELRHDSLADVISRSLTPEEEEDLKLRAVIESRYAEYQVTGSLIKDPDLLQRFLRRQRGLDLSSEVQAFAERSVSRPEALKKRRRKLVGVLLLATLVGMVIAYIVWKQRGLVAPEELSMRADYAPAYEELAREVAYLQTVLENVNRSHDETIANMSAPVVALLKAELSNATTLTELVNAHAVASVVPVPPELLRDLELRVKAQLAVEARSAQTMQSLAQLKKDIGAIVPAAMVREALSERAATILGVPRASWDELDELRTKAGSFGWSIDTALGERARKLAVSEARTASIGELGALWERWQASNYAAGAVAADPVHEAIATRARSLLPSAIRKAPLDQLAQVLPIAEALGVSSAEIDATVRDRARALLKMLAQAWDSANDDQLVEAEASAQPVLESLVRISSLETLTVLRGAAAPLGPDADFLDKAIAERAKSLLLATIRSASLEQLRSPMVDTWLTTAGSLGVDSWAVIDAIEARTLDIHSSPR